MSSRAGTGRMAAKTVGCLVCNEIAKSNSFGHRAGAAHLLPGRGGARSMAGSAKRRTYGAGYAHNGFGSGANAKESKGGKPIMERSERETNIRNYAGYVKPLWGGKKSFWLYIQNGRIIEFSRAPILDGYVDATEQRITRKPKATTRKSPKHR